MGHRLTPFLVVTVAAAALAGVIAAGQATRGELDAAGFFAVAVADIACEPPKPRSREQFLGEVQYLGQLPDRVDRSDPQAIGKVTAAFAKHPSVEKVTSVSLWPKAEAKLTHRVPALVVGPRVLDRRGVVLPKGTESEGVPVLRGAKPQTVSAGQPWPEPAVVAAAQVIGWLRGQSPGVVWIEAELTADGLVLFRPDGSRVTWGGKSSDPPPAAKLERLKATPSGDLDLRKPPA